MEVSRAQGPIQQSCQTFYNNLQLLYNKHNYHVDHIWNNDETRIQVGKQAKAKVLTKHGSQQVYKTIPKSRELWIVESMLWEDLCQHSTYSRVKYTTRLY